MWGGVFPDPNPEWRRVYLTRVSHMYVHTCVEDGQTLLLAPPLTSTLRTRKVNYLIFLFFLLLQ